jgi:phage tail tube protein FII
MTQTDAIATINEANIQLRAAMDKLDMQERIIATQEELIQLLQHSLEGRNKFITVLENQLSIQDNANTSLITSIKANRFTDIDTHDIIKAKQIING